MPRASSTARRRIRAKASGVSSRLPMLYAPPPRKGHPKFDLAIPVWVATWEVQATRPRDRLHRSGDPVEAKEWGERWAAARKAAGLDARYEVVQASQSLYSEASEWVDEETGETKEVEWGQPEPSTEAEVDAVSKRMEEILGTLASRVPYGEIKDYWLGFQWTEWVAEEGMEPYPWQTKFWSTTVKPSPLALLEEIDSGLREILQHGKDAANLWRYLHPGSEAIAFLEVDRLAVEWRCGECEPEEQVETPETIALHVKPKRKKPAKAKQRQRKQKKAKAKAKRKVRRK